MRGDEEECCFGQVMVEWEGSTCSGVFKGPNTMFWYRVG